MMIYGIYTGDSRLIGEVSLFACVETGYWLFTALEKNKKEKEGVLIPVLRMKEY